MMEKTRKTVTLFAVSAFVIAAILFANTVAAGSSWRDLPENGLPVQAALAAPSSPPPMSYVVRSYMGKVAVFDGIGEDPLDVLDVWVNDLPEDDRNMLELGIRVSTEEALRRILEDFTG